MRFQFADDELRRLYSDPDFHLPRLGPDLTTQYRRKMQVLVSAGDERDLRAMRSLHFEKLAGKRAHQHSIRLNDQFRLILQLEADDEGRFLNIVEITDYH